MRSHRPAIFVLTALAACGGSDAADDAAPDATLPVALVVEWTPCTLDTAAREPAECATVRVPYRWADPAATTLDVFVKRLRATGERRGAVWFLQGGPGASARAFDGLAAFLATRDLGLDFYMLDQRGTGRSSRLGCPAQEAAGTPGGYAIDPAEWPACIAAMQAAWEPTLAGFSVTETAHDLGELIAVTRDPGAQAFVFGVSYAPYLVNRYLQLYPDQPTGVVLDSICSAVGCEFAHADAEFDVVAHAYLDACGADPVCASRLGPDPWATLGEVYAGLDAGACPAATTAGLTRTTLRHAFASLLYGWDPRGLVPAMIHRLRRCGAQDLPVIARFGQLVNAPPTAAGLEDFSTALAYHVGLSELWAEPAPPLAEVEAAEAEQLISVGVSARMAARHPDWPRVPHDAYFGAWAQTAAPLLMLAGTLDPATPLALQLAARDAFAGPHQTFVTVPRAPHGVLTESPVAGALPCGMTLFLQFLRDPAQPIDTTCTTRVMPLDFATNVLAMPYFGTADLWGD